MPDSHGIRHPHDLYFLTFTVVDWMDIFTRKELRLIITENLNHCIAEKGLVVHAWVVMSNHVHLVAYARGPLGMGVVLRDYKKFTSKAMRQWIAEERESRKRWLLDVMAFRARQTARAKEYKLWQDGSYAKPIISQAMLQQKVDYIHRNPVEAMIVDRPEDYVFSSARDYFRGEKGLVDIELL